MRWYNLLYQTKQRPRRQPLSYSEKQYLRAKTLHQIAVNRSINVRLPKEDKPRVRYKLRVYKIFYPQIRTVWK